MLHAEHKAHSALSGILAMALAAGCLVTTAFAADLNQNAESVKSSAVTVQAASDSIKLESEPGALNQGAEVSYTVTTADNSTAALSLEDMTDLGDGNYQVTTNIDGEDVTLTVHVGDED